MEVTRSKAVKSNFSLSGLIGKLNKTFQSTEQVSHSTGEGSSFLSIPTKRTFIPSTNSNEETFLDYTPYLVPFILVAAAPDLSSRRASKDLRQLVIRKFNLPNTTSSVHSSRRASEVRRPSGLVSSILPFTQEEESIMEEILSSPLVPTEQQWNALNQMRIQAAAPEKTERGIQNLMQYYAQLCWLEERFPFEVEKVQIPFTWYEAFYRKRSTCLIKSIATTSCIQYEKAAVMWNIGAVYSQMAANQCLWTQDGLKSSALYFQMAAGAFVHVRDVLCPRIKIHVEDSSDLSQVTLTAAIEIMLAQAIECYYQKAEYDNTSSPVTSQIAIQVADYFDIAIKSSKQGNSFGKSRFPKDWQTNLQTKQLMYTALAHFHCPNSLPHDTAVGERQSRLKLATQFINQALAKSSSSVSPVPGDEPVLYGTSVSPELAVQCATTMDRIQRALNSIDSANFETFHQPVLPVSQLIPLKRPPVTLVSPINVIDGSSKLNREGQKNNLSLMELIQNNVLRDIFEGVIGVMCMRSGLQSPIVPSSINPSTVNSRRESYDDWKPIKEMKNIDKKPPLEKGNSTGAIYPTNLPVAEESGPSMVTLDLVKKFVWDIKKEASRYEKELLESSKSAANILSISVSDFTDLLHTLEKEEYKNLTDLGAVVTRAHKLISLYTKCNTLNQSVSTSSMYENILTLEEWMTDQLKSSYQQNWENNGFRDQLTAASEIGDHEVSELLKKRSLIRQLVRIWYEQEREDDSERLPFDFQYHRDKLFQLISIMEIEGFNELFPSSNNELCWSISKLETVIPCLESNWIKSVQKTLTDLQAFYIGIASVNRRHSNLLSSNKVVDNVSHVTRLSELVPLVVKEYKTYMKKIDSLHSKLELFHARLLDEEDRLLGGHEDAFGKTGDSRRASQPIHIHRHAVLETLTKAGQGDANISQDNAIKNGIHNTREHIYGVFNDIGHVLDEAAILLNVFQTNDDSSIVISSRYNHLLSSISLMLQTEQESDQIIAVFEEQLQKWSNWREECDLELQEWEPIKNWMVEFFDAPLPQVDNRPKSVEERVLEYEQKFLSKLEQNNTNKQNNRPSPFSQRKQMLRAISMTASSIQKQAQELKATPLPEDDLKRDEILRNQHAALLNQMRILRDQQLQMIRGNSKKEEKKSSFVSQAKDTIMDILSSPRRSKDSKDQAKNEIHTREHRFDSGIGPSTTNLFEEPTAPALHEDSYVEFLRQRNESRKSSVVTRKPVRYSESNFEKIHNDDNPVSKMEIRKPTPTPSDVTPVSRRTSIIELRKNEPDATPVSRRASAIKSRIKDENPRKLSVNQTPCADATPVSRRASIVEYRNSDSTPLSRRVSVLNRNENIVSPLRKDYTPSPHPPEFPKTEKTEKKQWLEKIDGDIVEKKQSHVLFQDPQAMELKKGMEQVSRFMGWHVQRSK